MSNNAQIYREFTLASPMQGVELMTLLKANAAACVERGSPLRVIVTEESKRRNSEQNRRLWGYLYKTIAEQAWVNEKQYTKDIWHEFFAREFGVCDEMVLPTGEIITRRKSTTEMSVKEFADFMQQIEIYAAQQLGVEWI